MTVAVDGVEIPERAILAEMQYHPAPSAEAAREAAARALAVRLLLASAAASRGLGEDDAAIERLIEDELEIVEPDDEACRRHWEETRAAWRAPDLAEAQHILIAAAPDDAEARREAKAKAEALLAELRAAPERFGALAREHSRCPSAASDGHLGQIARGSAVPEFETYLFALDEGELCGAPVPSRYGFHVLRCLAKAEGRELPWEAARPRVAERLRERAWREALAGLIGSLAAAARVEGVALGGAPTA